MAKSKIIWREPEDAGMVLGFYLLAKAGPAFPLIVLGQYCTEDDEYSKCDTGEEWKKFLLDEAVRLAEEKGLGSETMLIVASEKYLLLGES
tara:strand:- start:3524 stop:3796 length:273 start_codon:yes stop_codon:yes gene_type:complete